MEQPSYTRRNPRPKKRRPTTITVPTRVGPHVKLVFTEMQRQNITYDEVEEGSGVRRAALKAWRHKNRPNLDSIEAALGFLGYDFVPVPRAKVLPPEIVSELREVAARMNADMPATVQALVEIVTGIHSRFSSPSDELGRPTTSALFARTPRSTGECEMCDLPTCTTRKGGRRSAGLPGCSPRKACSQYH